MEYMGRKRAHNTIARGKTKDDGTRGKDNRRKVFWTTIYNLQVHLFSPGARKHGTEFKPDKEATEREGKAGHPK